MVLMIYINGMDKQTMGVHTWKTLSKPTHSSYKTNNMDETLAIATF
jgi:hypothetical protein